jgi:hypothetical protein
VDGADVLASATQYDLAASVDQRPVRASGLGAILTLPGHGGIPVLWNSSTGSQAKGGFSSLNATSSRGRDLRICRPNIVVGMLRPYSIVDDLSAASELAVSRTHSSTVRALAVPELVTRLR